MSSFGPPAADQAAIRRQQSQTENNLVTGIQSDVRRSTLMRMRTYGLGFQAQPMGAPMSGTIQPTAPSLFGAIRNAFPFAKTP